MIPVQYNPLQPEKLNLHTMHVALFMRAFYFQNITIAFTGRFIYSQNVLTTFCFFSMKAIRECFYTPSFIQNAAVAILSLSVFSNSPAEAD